MAVRDRAPLTALLAYQKEAIARYAAASGDRLAQLHAEAEDAARLLEKALVAAGGEPPQRPESRDGGLEAIIQAEESLVAGCYSAMQSLEQARHLRVAAAVMAQSGRRLVILRDLAGDALLPRAFETGGA